MKKFEIKKAERRQKKLRCLISGQPGAGKTLSSILLAMGLTGRGKVLIFDVENKRASLKAGSQILDGFEYDIVEADPVSLGRPLVVQDFIDGITLAEEEGYDALIIDSTTSEWEAVNDFHNALTGKNSYINWGKAKQLHQKFVDKFLYAKCHIILTARSKVMYEQQDVGGRKEVVKLGLGTQQDSNLPYFCDFVFDIENRDTHIAVVDKQEGDLFSHQPRLVLQESTGKLLKDWLEGGVSPELEKKKEYVNRIIQLQSNLVAEEKLAPENEILEEKLLRMSLEELTNLGKTLKLKSS